MPKISNKKQAKIQEQILHHLYSISPQSAFTAHIAQEIARDEEFVKALLQDLKSKFLVTEINKNPEGLDYKRRQRWRLSNQAFTVFKNNNP
ncbi:hypothetical protein COU62_04280 [Candidatus Pacearchaeota archaeon CG10_big_fil_rev_8_21_14_0_10_35_219]|nr:hypothetical protein [Candidatus Pacearchaeota archaeon]OIO42204.1 MAG: hypothetical protein AUJ63_02895 [Candidatus Pacearchaeota archaeon CG1_02_35_32]PIO07328.1 MAG: hypothetical protein COU62_04280 [Candidatus Pacearchaeota archaeon CG10_big_fil_rev_8_21_14_0_10_35_219]PIY81378.1 MAG: hypothetical protein COY79_03825 [Candidatus Pacearchaeota archaeon CG_4_10_14_0_8_um_filter_35_169]PIZ79834.1 MAG: hypothetical protein COY00_03330 [Candidatus Pacearchaeota archaeon CG_4_10_14_0_2_um_filt